ncbi:HK97 family phage prohead protease [Vitiosangium sp. GDMCC 1.1324]|uniref:HK97 family phage prohead protease n=1 Tax=Vitiosangium sp. (strain GDMCC 1.1324) TaxID=2138576 RepID=UPI000D379811|nr:HK97 family phage prohead protease [Vitiosangium sp. GDMCC 1.1324]PTL79096.1 hypothetical protein DAT35_36420 [Vitiosangium sp. GDMCC 1.1324]
MTKPTTTPKQPLRVKAIGQLVRKAEGAGAQATGKPVFRITAATLDRHLDRMLPTALKVEAYASNPVVLWNHNDREPAIGTARVYQEGEEWLAEITFSEVTQLARDVSALVAEGTLRTCSIGFIIDDFENNDEGGWDYLSAELCELSITNVPAVREAQRVKNTNGKNEETQTEPPTEGEPTKAKALDQETLDAIKAAVTEAMKPCMEALAQLQASLTKSSEETPTEEQPADTETEPKAADTEQPEPRPEEQKSASGRTRFLFCT